MLIGIHLPNGPVTDSDWAQIERIRPGVVSTMQVHHGADVLARLEQISRPTYLVRVGAGVQDAPGALADLARAVTAVQQAGIDHRRVCYRIGNEPNHEGWSAEQYRDVLGRCLAYGHERGVPIMAANLCLKEGWQQYLRAIAPAVEACHAIGLSLYHDDASDPARWLGEYQRFGLPLYAVEWGTPAYRGDERTTWFRWSGRILAPHLAGATAYLVGGTDDWATYRLTQTEAEGLAGIVAENTLRPFGQAVRG